MQEIDIGEKIRRARSEAKLTQEQAAEALGVSRQTISNWENEKTYPDIISVIRMSDLYSVSLDRLLKEDKTMSNYLNYLEESTNAVQSKKTLGRLMTVLSYLLIWSLGLIVFWFFTSGSDAMGFSIMFLWILLPAATFAVSLIIGILDFWGKLKWLAAPILGVFYMLAEYATFSTANMVSFGKFNMPQFFMIVGGGVISAIGLLIGSAICAAKRKKKQVN